MAYIIYAVSLLNAEFVCIYALCIVGGLCVGVGPFLQYSRTHTPHHHPPLPPSLPTTPPSRQHPRAEQRHKVSSPGALIGCGGRTDPDQAQGEVNEGLQGQKSTCSGDLRRTGLSRRPGEPSLSLFWVASGPRSSKARGYSKPWLKVDCNHLLKGLCRGSSYVWRKRKRGVG